MRHSPPSRPALLGMLCCAVLCMTVAGCGKKGDLEPPSVIASTWPRPYPAPLPVPKPDPARP